MESLKVCSNNIGWLRSWIRIITTRLWHYLLDSVRFMYYYKIMALPVRFCQIHVFLCVDRGVPAIIGMLFCWCVQFFVETKLFVSEIFICKMYPEKWCWRNLRNLTTKCVFLSLCDVGQKIVVGGHAAGWYSQESLVEDMGGHHRWWGIPNYWMGFEA